MTADDVAAGPSAAVAMQLAGLWREVFGDEQTRPDANFFAIGGTSLSAISFLGKLRESSGRAIGLDVLRANPTLAALCAQVRAASVDESPDPLVLINAGVARTPLVCLHSLTGTAVRYRNLAEDFPHARIYAFQSAGLLGGVQTAETLETLADRYARRWIAADAGAGILLGYSFGGVLANAVARRLDELGQPPQLLILIDVRLDRIGSPSRAFHTEALRLLGGSLGVAAALSGICDDALTVESLAEAVHASRQSTAITATDLSLWAEVMATHLRLLADHTFEPYRGTTGFIAAAETGPPTWLDSGDHALIVVPGDHYSIFNVQSQWRLTAAVTTLTRRLATHADWDVGR
ncbi:thioesterase domain-containing protein [Nocardia africana]|uniref:Thioesterase domain-containing protein n=1 Tax=Nocardia africana TaxID=134964 RepID=A0ABW6NCS2_9NOCA